MNPLKSLSQRGVPGTCQGAGTLSVGGMPTVCCAVIPVGQLNTSGMDVLRPGVAQRPMFLISLPQTPTSEGNLDKSPFYKERI